MERDARGQGWRSQRIVTFVDDQLTVWVSESAQKDQQILPFQPLVLIWVVDSAQFEGLRWRNQRNRDSENSPKR